MHLSDVEINGFKNLNLSVQLDNGVNLIVAPNGTGKTNLIEAVYLLLNGNSFKSYPEINLIDFNGKEFGKVTGNVDSTNLSVIISKFSAGSQKKLIHNGKSKTLNSYNSGITTIFFSPQSVDIVGGAPDVRRRDMDEFLSSIDRNYKNNITQYKKVLKNRNRLLSKLKAGFGSLDELDFWNEALIKFGVQVINLRLGMIEELKKDMVSVAKQLFRSEFNDIDLVYESTLDTENPEDSFRKSIIENLDKEINTTLSQFGPHRDDLGFRLSNFDARLAGSRGQQRIMALIFKIAQLEKTMKLQSTPIFLLDDVMSELDEGHRENIQNYIQGQKFQTIITSSDENEFNDKFTKAVNYIELKKLNQKS